MKIGFSLPNIGPIGTAEAVTRVAQCAEVPGYSSLWTIERLLYPLKLQRPYPRTPGGHLSEIYKQVLDPLDTLTYVAAHTKKIRLGASRVTGHVVLAGFHEQAERQVIIDALKAASGKISGRGGTAERLRLKRTTLQNKMRKLNISRGDYSA